MDRKKWGETLKRRRNEYSEFVRDIIIRPGYKEKDDTNLIDHVRFYFTEYSKVFLIFNFRCMLF